MDADCDCLGRIEGHCVCHILRETQGKLRHASTYILCSLYRVRTGELIEGEDSRRLAVIEAYQVIGLSSPLNAGNILQAHNRAILVGPQDDVSELLGCGQTALSEHCVCE